MVNPKKVRHNYWEYLEDIEDLAIDEADEAEKAKAAGKPENEAKHAAEAVSWLNELAAEKANAENKKANLKHPGPEPRSDAPESEKKSWEIQRDVYNSNLKLYINQIEVIEQRYKRARKRIQAAGIPL